jgi:hypothetical protein
MYFAALISPLEPVCLPSKLSLAKNITSSLILNTLGVSVLQETRITKKMTDKRFFMVININFAQK